MYYVYKRKDDCCNCANIKSQHDRRRLDSSRQKMSALSAAAASAAATTNGNLCHNKCA